MGRPSSISKRVKIFEKVRDKRFCLTGPNSLACLGKCNLLKQEFETINLDCRLMEGNFYWSDLNLPLDLKRLIVNNSQKHVFLEVLIPETQKWARLDPTWDMQLRDVFTISTWDGQKSTALIAKLRDIREYKKASLFNRLMQKNIMWHDKNAVFFETTDKWLASVRRIN